MTLPTEKPISLAQVRAEFGAPLGTALGAFVRGGAWVPDVPQNSGVPTAKPISLGNLLGATRQDFNLSNRSNIASFTLRSEGTTIPAVTGEWALVPVAGLGADYECEATLVSGPTPSGDAVGSWLSLSTNRAWSQPGPAVTNLTVKIRPAGGGATLASATVLLGITT